MEKVVDEDMASIGHLAPTPDRKRHEADASS